MFQKLYRISEQLRLEGTSRGQLIQPFWLKQVHLEQISQGCSAVKVRVAGAPVQTTCSQLIHTCNSYLIGRQFFSFPVNRDQHRKINWTKTRIIIQYSHPFRKTKNLCFLFFLGSRMLLHLGNLQSHTLSCHFDAIKKTTTTYLNSNPIKTRLGVKIQTERRGGDFESLQKVIEKSSTFYTISFSFA